MVYIVSYFTYFFILKKNSEINILSLKLQLFCLIITLFRWHLIILQLFTFKYQQHISQLISK